MEKLKITLVDTDTLNEDNHYYLYEVESSHAHYYMSTSDEELDANPTRGETDYSNEYHMYNRKDFTDREWEIAKYLFNFLWDSDNGTNTCVEQEIYEEDGFNREEISDFVTKFHFQEIGVLEEYEEGGFEIYWAYFSCFNLKTCDFWEDTNCDESEPEPETGDTTYYIVFDSHECSGGYLDKFQDLASAKKYRDNYNAKPVLVAEYGKVHIEAETKTRKVVE